MSNSQYAFGTDPQETLKELYDIWGDFCRLINLTREFTDTRDSANYEPMRPLQDYACVILFWLGFNVDDLDTLAAENAAWEFPPRPLLVYSYGPRRDPVERYQVLHDSVNVRLKTLAWRTDALSDLRNFLKENQQEAARVVTYVRLTFQHSGGVMHSVQA